MSTDEAKATLARIEAKLDALSADLPGAVVKRLLGTDLTPNDDENDRTVRAALNKAANLRDEQKKADRG